MRMCGNSRASNYVLLTRWEFIVRIGIRGFVAVFAAMLSAVVGRNLSERRFARRTVGRRMELVDPPDVIEVHERLWRGPAPSAVGYAALAEAGVRLVVDMRSEIDLVQVGRLASESGVSLLSLPVDNSRAPEPGQLERFVGRHEEGSGVTYVHCEAGEGRTGAIIGAYQVRAGCSVGGALADGLAVGSLTFSQMAYITSGGRGPATMIRAIDCLLDRPTEAPFRLAHRLTVNSRTRSRHRPN